MQHDIGVKEAKLTLCYSERRMKLLIYIFTDKCVDIGCNTQPTMPYSVQDFPIWADAKYIQSESSLKNVFKYSLKCLLK